MTCVRSPQKVCISACELAHSTPLPLGSGTADNVTVVLLEDSAGGQQKTPPTRVASHVGSILDCTFFASNQQVRTHTHTHTHASNRCQLPKYFRTPQGGRLAEFAKEGRECRRVGVDVASGEVPISELL